MVEPLRHRQTKEADNRYVWPTATAPHLDSTKTGNAQNRANVVRFAPISDRRADTPDRQLRARRRHYYTVTQSPRRRIRARSGIARCEVRYNRDKVLLVEIGYNLGHQRAPFSRSGAVLEVIELPEHVAR